MKNKFLKIALTVITIAVIGQIGMRLFYPQPEPAKAAIFFYVHAYWLNGMVLEDIDDADIEIRIKKNNNPDYEVLEPFLVSNGVYSFAYTGSQYVSWSVRYKNDEWIAVDPFATLPDQFSDEMEIEENELEWQFAFIM